MRLNVAATGPNTLTHEGAPAPRLTPIKELRRSVLTALLWENSFYEKGSAQADRVAALVPKINPQDVAALAVEARDRMYLRHVPLFLVRELARVKGNGSLVAGTLEHVIQRPDELTEYLALYWRDNKDAPLSAGSKRGLAQAFRKFNEYTLAKYDRDSVVKLRDVLRLVHAKPETDDRAGLWKRVVGRTLETPDTWEVQLSAGKDKRETFERLLRDKKLGGLAFLRNLRNMIEAKVDAGLIRERFGGKLDKILPFRFIAAVRHAPAFATELNDAMVRAVADEPKLSGRTVVMVDVSGSMDVPLSDKSEVQRIDAAAGVGVLVRELCAECRVFTFSNAVAEVPAYRGLAMVDSILRSQPHQGTYLGQAVTLVDQHADYDRIIVVTDEQSHDRVPAPKAKGYMINVAGYEYGVGYGPWTHIDGWSERVLDFIRETEQES
jgi:60 kDa SS-A/Ro ribonucleoprotein